MLHDQDSIFSQQLDQHVRNLGLRVLKTPSHSPQANALCERLLGTLQWECVDGVIPLTENHLRRLLSAWGQHYNHWRPHMSLGPGMPQPPPPFPVARQTHWHRIAPHLRVMARPILGGGYLVEQGKQGGETGRYWRRRIFPQWRIRISRIPLIPLIPRITLFTLFCHRKV
jgi:hypothetical protein